MPKRISTMTEAEAKEAMTILGVDLRGTFGSPTSPFGHFVASRGGPPASAAKAPAPGAQDAPSDADRGDRPEARRPGRLAAMLHGSSSWVVSTVVHAILIMVLGLLTITLAEKDRETVLFASIDGSEAELDDTRLDEVTLEQNESLSASLIDPGAARFSEVQGAVSSADMRDVGTLAAAPSTKDFGALFGKDGKGLAASGEGVGGATFFGVRSSGRKFVFCVDGSKSMRNNGWEECKAELMAAVSRLKPEQLFYVMLFADTDYRMFGKNNESRGLVPATPENIQKLYQWLYTFDLVLGTKPYTSIRFAMELKPDAIYLLTDGQFQDGTEQFLAQNNRREDAHDGTVPRAAVHTIGFLSDKGQELLLRIAKNNGGTYRFVPGER